MITISLNQIAAHSPCSGGWEKILNSRGIMSDHDVQFPLADAFESNGLDDVLWALRCLPEHDQLWRKFVVWCARRVQHLATDRRLSNTLDVAWRHSDGMATDEELKIAWEAAWEVAWEVAREAAWEAARVAAGVAARVAAGVAAGVAARVAAGVAAREAERSAQTAKLRQILSAGHWVED